jgi:RNA-binding protein
MLSLTPAERRRLRASAHGLAPVVLISEDGLSDAVFAEIERALTAHELIKLRAFSDARDEREAWLAAICERTGAQPVQHIGKVLVVYRKRPPQPPPRAAAKRGAAGPRKTKKQLMARG